MQLDLSPSEADVVADILESALGELREEVYKAEVADYKTALKEREAVLTTVLQRLGRRPANTSA